MTRNQNDKIPNDREEQLDEIQRRGHHLNWPLCWVSKTRQKNLFIAVAKVPSYSLVDKRYAWPVTTHIPRTFQLLTRQSVLMWSYFKCNSNWQLSHKNSLRLVDTERSTLWLLSCKFGIFLTPAISPTLHKKYYRIILTNLPKVETMQNTNTQQLTGGDLPMANTSNTSGMSLSRSILLQHFLSNGWYQLYISWDLLKVGRFPSVSRHHSLSRTAAADPGESKPATALWVGWSRAWGRVPAHTCLEEYLLTKHHMVQLPAAALLKLSRECP